jgi:hypothetical protein
MNQDYTSNGCGDPADDDRDGSQAIPAVPHSHLLTAVQAAEMLCISEATLWELVKRDRLQCVEFVATGFRRPIRRFRLRDLMQFIEDSLA